MAKASMAPSQSTSTTSSSYTTGHDRDSQMPVQDSIHHTELFIQLKSGNEDSGNDEA